MKKAYTKKILSMLMAVMMIVTLSPAFSFAAGNEEEAPPASEQSVQTPAEGEESGVQDAETDNVTQDALPVNDTPGADADSGAGDIPEPVARSVGEPEEESDMLPEEPLTEAPALFSGNNVPYIKCSWDGKKVVYTTEYKENVTEVPADGSMTKGWYYLNSNITLSSRISLTGDTYLILGDGFTLDVKSIYFPLGSTLTIYAQSNGKSAGTINSHPSDGAAIGAYSGHRCGNIEIHGGNIIAKGASHCAGIGSNDGQGTTSPITIYGGKITATGGSDGAGIGGGRSCDGGNINIYGGEVTAEGGGQNGAGIGGGDDANGGTITIYGGTITANEDPNEDGAAIGGGDGKGGGTITINGGTIKTWSRDGACIGGGDDGGAGTITINGGTITCKDEGSAQGARIGSGSDGDDDGSITINGGKIDVYFRDGAGIGGGEDSDGGTIKITGGTVTTHPEGQGNAAGIGGGNHGGGGGKITITGGKVTANSNHGAGIGGGRAAGTAFYEFYENSGEGGTISISGGEVNASSKRAYGIGAGGSEVHERTMETSGIHVEIGSSGKITISGTAKVTTSGHLAGIGGDGGAVTITGGDVTTSGRDDNNEGYGIHFLDSSGRVNISGGKVTAIGKYIYSGISTEHGRVTISGGTVYAYAKDAAGIGSGAGKGADAPDTRESSSDGRSMRAQGTLTIEGNDTFVSATSDYNGLGATDCVGNGKWYFKPGARIEVTIRKSIAKYDTKKIVYDGARITAGSSKENAAPIRAEERDNANGKYKYRLIEPCDHKGTTENGRCWACGQVLEASYVEYSWTDGELKHEDKTVQHPSEFPASSSIESGTYVLNKNITIKDRVILKGDTDLILGDGYTLKVNGLYIPNGKTLTIYGQSSGTGKLISEPGTGAGIGGYSGHAGGNIVIHGGTIRATGADHCAGIGSNDGQGSDTGSFTMYYGDVTATGGSNGAGIGGGRECDAGKITIYGGTVTATGKNDSAGIGGGDSDNSSHGNAGSIRIYGGNVTASCSGAGAAIGGADYGTADIDIQGGTIKATCSGKGKGIGGGSKKSPDESSITLDYAVGATSADISVLASSLGGKVTLIKPFKNNKGKFSSGEQNNLTQMDGSPLVPWDCEADGHDWEKATCTAPKTCKLCGKTEGKPLGHDYRDIEGTAKTATCTEPGKKADQECSRCGAKTGGADISALGHEWIINGSTNEYGWRAWTTGDKIHEERNCNRCGIKEEREYDQDHSIHIPANVQEQPATCIADGMEAHVQCEVCKHLFVVDENGDLKEVQDSDLIITAKGHADKDPVRENEVPASCTKDGSYDSVVYCAVCNKELRRTPCTTPALDHDYQDIDGTAKAATCTEPGKEADQKCSRCGTPVGGADIPAPGHDWSEPEYKWAEDNSTVTATKACKRDGCSETETETVNVTSEVTKPATCTEKGETTYTSDSFENIRFDFQEKTVADIPALGHDYIFTEWTWIGNETDGYTEATIHYECCGDGCEQTQQLVVEPKEIRIEPTCTEGGKTIYGAEISEAKAYDDIARSEKKEAKLTDPLGHDWGEWVITKKATSTEEGSETRTCARCKETETREIPPLPVRYKITLINKNVWGGTISVDKTKAAADDEVTVTVRPKGTYSPWVTVRSTRYGSIYIRDLEMTGKNNTFTGSFSMPAYPVKVIVDFTRAGVQEPEQDAVLMAELASEADSSLTLSWNWIEEAEGYDVFLARCGKGKKYKKVKTLEGNESVDWTIDKLKKKASYKAYVRAWVMKGGKKTYILKSPEVHAYTSGSKARYTTAKSVTVNKQSVHLKKGRTYKIKAGVTKLYKSKKLIPVSHAAKLRYLSSNKKVATVSKAGRIKAKKKGTCYIYVYAPNGVFETMEVVVE